MRQYIAFTVGTLMLPLGAQAATLRNFEQFVDLIVGFINGATALLVTVGIAVFFWGISTNVIKFEDDPEKRKAYFFWGVIVIFVIVSVWGIIRILQSTLVGWGVET